MRSSWHVLILPFVLLSDCRNKTSESQTDLQQEKFQKQENPVPTEPLKSQPQSEPANNQPAPEPVTLIEKINQAIAKHNDELLILARDNGIWVVAPDLHDLFQLSSTKASFLVWDSRPHQESLLFFNQDATKLSRLDLQTGNEEEVIEIPNANSPCFDIGEPGSYGSFIQTPYDVGIDPKTNFFCFYAQDRNDNMSSIRVNIAVDLKQKQIHTRLMEAEDECKGPQDILQKSLCTPQNPSSYGDTIPEVDSQEKPLIVGEWTLTERIVDESDYIYSSLFLKNENDSNSVYGVFPQGIRILKPSELKKLPTDICTYPGEAQVYVFNHHHRLIIHECNEGPLLVDLKKRSTTLFQAHSILAFRPQVSQDKM